MLVFFTLLALLFSKPLSNRSKTNRHQHSQQYYLETFKTSNCSTMQEKRVIIRTRTFTSNVFQLLSRQHTVNALPRFKHVKYFPGFTLYQPDSNISILQPRISIAETHYVSFQEINIAHSIQFILTQHFTNREIESHPIPSKGTDQIAARVMTFPI